MSIQYRLEITRQAVSDLSRIDKAQAKRITAALRKLDLDPRPHGAIQLKGSAGLLRMRVGDYRIIYEVKDMQLLLLVIKIAHRREAYRGL